MCRTFFGATFPLSRTGGGWLTPTAWQSLPATPEGRFHHTLCYARGGSFFVVIINDIVKLTYHKTGATFIVIIIQSYGQKYTDET